MYIFVAYAWRLMSFVIFVGSTNKFVKLFFRPNEIDFSDSVPRAHCKFYVAFLNVRPKSSHLPTTHRFPFLKLEFFKKLTI